MAAISHLRGKYTTCVPDATLLRTRVDINLSQEVMAPVARVYILLIYASDLLFLFRHHHTMITPMSHPNPQSWSAGRISSVTVPLFLLFAFRLSCLCCLCSIYVIRHLFSPNFYSLWHLVLIMRYHIIPFHWRAFWCVSPRFCCRTPPLSVIPLYWGGNGVTMRRWEETTLK
jgi:hypothetical protein